MPESLNILLVGDNELSIIHPFVTELKSSNYGLKFSIVNPYHVSGKIDSVLLEPFDKVYESEQCLNYRLSIFQFVIFIFRNNNFIRYTKALIKGILTFKLKKEMMFVFSDYKYKLFWTKEIKKYDIIHHQALFDPQVKLLDIVKKQNKKVIISFWGSDLLNTNDINRIEKQKIALNLSDIVTAQTEEMRNVIKKKFGETIFQKSNSILFGISNMSLDKILSFKKLESKFNKNLIIQVGYNSSKAQNHLKIIQALSDLEQELRDRIKLVVPMGYGNGGEKYISEVELLANKFFKNVIVNTSYLSRNEYLENFSNVDVYLNLPETDAGNSTIYEALLLGANIIVGSWLPYSEFEKNGILLHRVDEFSHLPSLVKQILSSEIDKNNNQQTEKAYQMIAYSGIAVKWNDMYNNFYKV